MQTATASRRATVALEGELDHCTAPLVRARLDRVLDDPRITHLTLDLRALTFMDSSGVGVLLGRLKLLRERGGTLAVRGMPPPVEKLFRLSGMHRVIAVEDEGGR